MAGELARVLADEYDVSVHRVFAIISEYKKKIRAINDGNG
jgi:hypothetical protein